MMTARTVRKDNGVVSVYKYQADHVHLHLNRIVFIDFSSVRTYGRYDSGEAVAPANAEIDEIHDQKSGR